MNLHRSLFIIVLLFAIIGMHAAASAQPVDEIELLPPLGEPSVEAESTPEAIFVPSELSSLGDEADATWWSPQTWIASPLWDFGAELGLNGSSGNSQAMSVLAAFNGKRETDGNDMEWDLKYGKSSAGGLETQHYALFNSRWDWKFKPNWFLYEKNFIEYDEFKAFDLRLVLSAGLGHDFLKNDRTKLTGRLGAGASREFDSPEENWTPEANFGMDFEHKVSERQKFKLTSDYYPAWEDLRDYRMVTNAYWEILLDEETNLSLKLGAVDRYDSTPNGLKPNDIDYFATLLWKL